MNLLYLCIISILSIVFSPFGNGEKILFVNVLSSKSHKIFLMSIVEVLAQKGHHVTFVSSYEPFKNVNNVREILFQNFSIDSLFGNSFEKGSGAMPFITETPKLCVDGLSQESIQALKNEEFDLIILSPSFNFCYLSFVHHFKVPFIYAYPGKLFGPFHDMIGNLDFPSISGHILIDPGFPLTFTQRLRTTLLNIFYGYLINSYSQTRAQTECVNRGFCPADMPPFQEFHKNASLMIINSVRTLEWPLTPTMPNVIYAGGAHIKPPKKLPKDLEDWVEGSGEDGFIFFSLGSAVNTSSVPEKFCKTLVNVFGSLKQRVLWKWNEETMPDLPKNVKLQKWLPQSDLLGHPKIKLFITHGGQLSTLESSYHGVPVIGIPLYGDHHSNMEIVQSEGWGRVVNWETLEEEEFRNLIQEVVNNEIMAEIAKGKSLIMKDRLIPPAEEAVYWIEYVMRHKGAYHLSSPINMMHWYEVYNMDVWASIVLLITGALCILWLVFKFILSKCFGIGKLK